MGNRRDFIRQAALLSGGAGLWGTLPPAVKKAFSIDPEPGSTFYDAEHVVILMQENRSFDHLFGSLRGVRGFNDPRAVRLPSGNRVWVQSGADSLSYLPFRLDIRDTRATWMSSLPHSWESQVAASRGGRHDGWLEAKRSGKQDFADMPLTMGFYNREDLPFYYALADAFTVCDQYFCSSLTGTTPNRLFLWTGTIRSEQRGDSPANVDNADVDYDSPASWTTFPERLEAAGISWKIYQNELSVGVGFSSDEDAWLANFTDNPLEWFTQYQVGFLPAHRAHLEAEERRLERVLRDGTPGSPDYTKTAAGLLRVKAECMRWSADQYAALSDGEKRLHERAFTTNAGDPDYHRLTELSYKDGSTHRRMRVPKGDVLHQFRHDVRSGRLPTVSWLVAPENFSDHPGAPWYGAWFVSETLDILTRNPEIWKKTIFLLCYDENDGYFDHVPPFTAPDPSDPATGRCSPGITTETDYVTAAQVAALRGKAKDPKTVSPVGLGFRVPMVVASPWSRGGWVHSEVSDHTSVLRFLERFLSRRTGKALREEHISSWRRTVCGDLTAVFRPYGEERIPLPRFVHKDALLEEIHNAQFKKLPAGYHVLEPEEIRQLNADPASFSGMPRQEKGIRPSCALPYELYAEGAPDATRTTFHIHLAAGAVFFKDRSSGAPFTVYRFPDYAIRHYAVAAGDSLTDIWPLSAKAPGCRFEIRGPNGFFRAFWLEPGVPWVDTACSYERMQGDGAPSGGIWLNLTHHGSAPCRLLIRDEAYGTRDRELVLDGGEKKMLLLDTSPGRRWYDFSVGPANTGKAFARYAGRVETGEPGVSDPRMA